MKSIAAVSLLIAAALPAAQAGTVYRCGNAYAEAPCPNGKQVEVGDTRSPSQRAEAKHAADSEHRLATEMRRDRLADERAIRPAGAGSLSGHVPTKVVVIPTERHTRKRAVARATTSDFIAYDPDSRKRRKE